MSPEELRSQIVSGSRDKHFQDFYDGQGKLNSQHTYASSFAGLKIKLFRRLHAHLPCY
jgi:hypothetical protein